MTVDEIDLIHLGGRRYIAPYRAGCSINLLLDLFGRPGNIPEPVMIQAISGSGMSVEEAYRCAERRFSILDPTVH